MSTFTRCSVAHPRAQQKACSVAILDGGALLRERVYILYVERGDGEQKEKEKGRPRKQREEEEAGRSAATSVSVRGGVSAITDPPGEVNSTVIVHRCGTLQGTPSLTVHSL